MNHILQKLSFLALSLLMIHSLKATQGVSAAQIQSVAIQTDGTILVGGYVILNNVNQFMTAHFTATGGVDGAYGTAGYFAVTLGTPTSQANGMVLLSDNEAVLAGYAEPSVGTSFAIAQITSAGVLDTSFNSGGSVPGTNTTLIGGGCSANAIALDGNGNFLVGGVAVISGTPQFALARYTPAGILDTTFNSVGYVSTPINERADAFAIALQPNGQILLGGYSVLVGASNFAIARYNATTGALDTTFNASGAIPGTVLTQVGANAIAYGIALDSSGNIVAGGAADNAFALARYTSSGVLDTTFNSGGTFPGTIETVIGSNDQINAVAIQPNGAIVVAGFTTSNSTTQCALARYTPSGVLDTSFNSSGSIPGVLVLSIGGYSEAQALTIDSSGNILVAGTSDNNAVLARITPNGALDSSFGTSGSGYVSFPNTSVAPDIYGLTDINIASDAGIEYSKLNLMGSIQNTDISANAAIANSKLATLSTPGLVLNAATTATSTNTASAIVARDALGNFSAGTITASGFVGNVVGSSSNNILRAGDTMSGSLVLPAGSAANPSLQFSGNTNVGLSATGNSLTLSTNGVGALSINQSGSVTIATPSSSAVGLTIAGGGAAITGEIVASGNVVFNNGAAPLNVVGSSLGSLVKIYWGTGTSGVLGSTTIDYTNAGFANPPQIFLTSINGVINALGTNSVTATTATVVSAVNVPFNYLAIGT